MSTSPYKTNESKPSGLNPETEELPAIDRQWTPAFVARLLRDLPAIRDPRMRALALGDRLQPLTADDIFTVARRLHDELLRGAEAAFAVLDCFRDAKSLEERLGRSRMLELAEAAKTAGHEIAAVLIVPLEPEQAGGTRTHRDLRELTLGERKALARTPRIDMLVKLLDDDHPHVQHNLLSNPRLTVREVVGAAAKKPGLPHVLRGIARHPRWMHNYEVRRALAKNPDTPLDVSGRIVATLPRTDLDELVDDGRLNPTVRALAKQRIEALKSNSEF